MPLSLSNASIGVFDHMLRGLAGVLKKGRRMSPRASSILMRC